MKKWTIGEIVVFLALAVQFNPIFCKDFGTRGQVFPIEEESLADFFQGKLSKKDWNLPLAKVQEILLEQAKNPPAVLGLKPAQKSRAVLLDMSFKTPQDVTDTKGNVIIRAGTIINPLEKIKLSTGILFLDGSKQSHLTWAREQGENFKWILVCGKPIELEEKEERPIYFDQGGIYTARFQIKNIPAKVMQKGARLLIEEYALPTES